MGIFSKLFGSENSPPPHLKLNTKQAALLLAVFNTKPLVEHVTNILGDFGDVLADLLDTSQQQGTIQFFSESRLPHPRKTIEGAFLFAFAAMELLEMNDWVGIPKEALETTAHQLTSFFAPYVPDNQHDKARACLELQHRLGLERARRCELLGVPLTDDGALHDLRKHGMTRTSEQLLEWYPLDNQARLKRVIEFAWTECRKHNFPYETFTS